LACFSNEYYGGLWASFNLDGLQQWVDDCKKPKDETECAGEPQLAEGESAVKMRLLNPPTATNVHEQWNVPEYDSCLFFAQPATLIQLSVADICRSLGRAIDSHILS